MLFFTTFFYNLKDIKKSNIDKIFRFNTKFIFKVRELILLFYKNSGMKTTFMPLYFILKIFLN
jgi:hypothetical protein